MPSAHTYTGSRSSSRRCFHAAYSACQPAFSRAIDGADSGAASPSSPRRARSKSPWASPCRYSSGRSRPTSSVRRLNSGRSRLSNRAPSPRSRGRRIVIVPAIVLSRRGLPRPFRYPGAASTPSRRAYRRRPTTCSTSSSKSCCSKRWTPCRANASRLSHVGLDSAPVPVLFSFMGGVSFGGRSQRPRFGLWSPEGYTAFSSFTHPLTLPRQPRGSRAGRWEASWVIIDSSPGRPCSAELYARADALRAPLTVTVRCQGRTKGQGQRGRKAAGSALGKVGGAGDGTRGPEQVPDGTCDAAPGDEGWQTASREEYHETTEHARTDHHVAAVARGCAACGRCHRPAKVTQGAARWNVDLRLKHQYPGGWQQNRPPQSERHRDLYERRSLCFCECAR